MAFTLNPLSIKPSSIGDVYDLAIGFHDPNTGLTRMVGYVTTPGGTITEGTNLQDEEHLVQVASPSSSDRYGRYPRVSQGDWSGGERQLIFTTANMYYQSTQLDTTIPGHLTIDGLYYTVTIPNGIATGALSATRTVSSSSTDVYFLGQNATTYYVSSYRLTSGAGVVTKALTSGEGIPQELLRNSDHAIYVGTSTGIYWYTSIGTSLNTGQVTDDPVALQQGASMATFVGSAYYITGTSSPNAINFVNYPLPGAGAGTVAYTAPQMEHLVQALGRGPQGLVFVNGNVSTGTGISGQGNMSVYAFDGVNANFLGTIQTAIQDICEANGTVYLLTYAQAGTTLTSPLPVIYSVAGSTLSIFDDFRKLDPEFLPISAHTNGHIESDGQWLYLWTSGLSVKRYNLGTSGVSDVGTPACVVGLSGARSGTVLGDGSFVEIESTASETTAYFNSTHGIPLVDGTLLTSWFDFDTPDVDKLFKQIEFTLNTVVNSSAFTAVGFQINSQASPLVPITVQSSASGTTLVAYLPINTLGRKIRFSITLNHLLDPDVQSYGITATLARVFQTTLSCRRSQNVRGGTDRDPQSLTSTQLLANIQNCYTLAGGNVTMYIPDPTIDQEALDDGTPGAVAIGVSQINAVLQDYQRTTAGGVAPGYRQAQDGGSMDMEGDVQLTAVEALG